jgi:catechol 2,3-dioxygenase-like lactoylglutathione lyase family enzyme
MTSTATGIEISGLGQIQIRAHDVERAAAFYENVLGLKLLFKGRLDWRFSSAVECG